MVPVRREPAENFPGQRNGRRRFLAPNLTKSAVRHCYNPKPDQAWQVFPLAEKSFVLGDVPGSPGKLVFPKRPCRRRADATERVVQQPEEGRPAPEQYLPAAQGYPGRRV